MAVRFGGKPEEIVSFQFVYSFYNKFGFPGRKEANGSDSGEKSLFQIPGQ